MYNPDVFIITRRKELGIKHKKLLEALDCRASLFSKLDEAIYQIKTVEPEMIIVSDTIDDNLVDFIRKIRVLTYNFRPVIIALSKSDNTADKLEVLEAGSDDFINESVQKSEFRARINAHIRRQLENSINPVTNFVDSKLTLKALKKQVLSKNSRTALLISVSRLNFYREIYGEIAYEKVLQTLGAIINSTLQKEDIAGHYRESDFVLITPSIKAERIAKFLTFAFDSIIERFYTEYDFKNNFMLFSTETKEEKKIPLMKLDIALMEVGGGRFQNEKQVLELLFNTLKLCKTSEKSSYIIDRPKLNGEVSSAKRPNRVMAMETDEALNYLLEVSLNMRGYEFLGVLKYEDFKEKFEEFAPDLVILDYGNEDKKQGLEILNEIKANSNCNKGLKIIFSTNVWDKKNILSKGADLYLPKPYDITTLLDWVKKLID